MEQLSSHHLLLHESSAELGVPLNTEQVHLFMVYLKQLQIWNQSFNLTSITLDDEIIIKHFSDSMAALRVDDMKTEAKLLDVGTGAGFPGIPLKIARPDLHVTLVEPVKKKSSFLHFITGLLQLKNVTIFDGTLEKFMNKHMAHDEFDYVTTRALKHDVIFQYGAKLLRQDGKVILYSSQPITCTNISSNWLLVNDYSFQLQRGYGQRVISMLKPSA